MKQSSIDIRGLNPAGLFGKDGEGGKTKQFLGKFFKKKGTQELDTPVTSLRRKASLSPSSRSTNGSTTPPPNAGMNGSHPAVHVKAPSASTALTAAMAEHPHGRPSLGHATFGTAPLIIHRRSSGTMAGSDGAVTGPTCPASLGLTLPNSSAIFADRCAALLALPSSRPVGYTWTIRKWAKRNTDGWAPYLNAAAAAGLEMVNGAFTNEVDDDVVFEWVKMRGPASNPTCANIMRRHSTVGTIASTDRKRSPLKAGSTLKPEPRTNSPSPSRASIILAGGVKRADSPPPRISAFPSPRLYARPEPARRVSTSTSPASKRESVSETELTEDGDDSDPEDSETPWACSIWVKRTGHRQLLGTLTPAPHHPKVVGTLKIPMGLDPVSLIDVHGTGEKQVEMANRVREAVALSEENLKDVVCVTAMWLVAREEFGGLGKKRKV